MIVEKAFLDKLKEFGLNSYESKLWTALLSRGVSTAGELADISGVPRSRSYDVLESLSEKGFIMIKNSKPIKYVAVGPKEVIDRVKTKIETKTKEEMKQLESLKSGNIMSELGVLYKKGLETLEPTELTGSIKGRDNHMHHITTMVKNAKKSVVIQTSGEGLMRKAMALKPFLKEAKARGVKIRIAAPLTKDNKHLVKELSSVAEVKNSSSNARFVVVDDKEMMFMLMDDKNVHKNYDTAVWVNTPYFASAFSSLLNKSLKKA